MKNSVRTPLQSIQQNYGKCNDLQFDDENSHTCIDLSEVPQGSIVGLLGHSLWVVVM